MRWSPFIVLAWLLFGAELGLRDALQFGEMGPSPSFVAALVVFVAMSAPVGTAVGAGLIVGLLMDLTTVQAVAGGAGSIVVVGPYSLGMSAAAYAVVVTRGLVMRHNPLTFAFLTLLACVILHVSAVAVFALRSWFDPVAFSAGAELWLRLKSSLLSAGLALLLGPALRVLTPVFGFPSSQRSRQRVGTARRAG